MGSTTPPIIESLESFELGRHQRGNRCCWWNHLEARWECTSERRPHTTS